MGGGGGGGDRRERYHTQHVLRVLPKCSIISVGSTDTDASLELGH